MTGAAIASESGEPLDGLDGSGNQVVRGGAPEPGNARESGLLPPASFNSLRKLTGICANTSPAPFAPAVDVCSGARAAIHISSRRDCTSFRARHCNRIEQEISSTMMNSRFGEHRTPITFGYVSSRMPLQRSRGKTGSQRQCRRDERGEPGEETCAGAARPRGRRVALGL